MKTKWIYFFSIWLLLVANMFAQTTRGSDTTPVVPTVVRVRGLLRSALELSYGGAPLKYVIKDKYGIESAPEPGTSRGNGTCSVGYYYRQCLVVVRDAKNTVVGQRYTDSEGHYDIPFQGDYGMEYKLATEADDLSTQRSLRFYEGDPSTEDVDLVIEDRPVSLLTRAIVGFQQSSVGSQPKDQRYFFDLFFSQPLDFFRYRTPDPDFGHPLRVWGDVRLASVPQTVSDDVKTFVGGLLGALGAVKVSDLVDTVDALGGLEMRVGGDTSLLPSFDRQTKLKFSTSLIAGIGFSTPITSANLTAAQVFNNDPSLVPIYPTAAHAPYVTFVAPERNQFYRQYYAGLRLQSFYFNRYDRPLQRFPGMLDIMVGQNDFVRNRGAIIRIDGYLPLPYKELKFINLFGTGLIHAAPAKLNTPVILQAASPFIPVPGPDVAVLTLRQTTRDFYRIGIGIDFVALVNRLFP